MDKNEEPCDGPKSLRDESIKKTIWPVMSTIRFDLTFLALKCPFWEFKL